MARNRTLLPELVSLLALLGTARADAGAEASEVLRVANEAASRVTTCPATADDLGAEATLRFLRKRRTARAGESGTAGYVRRIVDNVRRDWLRRQGRVQSFSEIDASRLERAEPSDGRGNPAEVAEVAEFVAGLRPDERRVLELLIEGLGEREIADRTGYTRHAVRALIHRIRSRASEFFVLPGS